MTYRAAEDYLLGLELFGMRFGLDRMRRLMTALGMPQHRYAHIHVVGSNGKSSTVHFLAAILERHGVRTGSYTSPHLRFFRERVEVAEEPVSEKSFAAAVERVAQAVELVERGLEPDDPVTQFEALTAAAFYELALRNVEVGVIEAGLGGRYDATNVIPSRVQVLTGVALEHTRWLGPTVGDIAEEKLAVVRDHATLVVGELDPAVQAVAERVTREHAARLVKAPPALADVNALTPGSFQQGNLALAATAAEAFLGRALDMDAVRRVAAETHVAGRLEVVARNPVTIYDGAHNPAGAVALAKALPGAIGERRPLVLVLSVLEEKDAAGMLEALLPLADHLIFTTCANPRALSAATLERLATNLGAGSTETLTKPREAVERARAEAGPGGAVAVTGSIYLIADLVREEGQARASSL